MILVAWDEYGEELGEAPTELELLRIPGVFERNAFIGPRENAPEVAKVRAREEERNTRVVQIAVDAESEARIDDQISELSNTDLGMLLLLAAQENNERIWQSVKAELSERRGPQTPGDNDTRVRTLFSLVSSVDMSLAQIIKKKPADTTGSDLKQAALWAYIILVWIAASHGFWAILNLP